MKLQKQKRRPSLEELKAMPRDMWELECAHIAEVAKASGLQEVEQMAVDLLKDGSMVPADVIGLRDHLQRVASEKEAA